MVTSLGPTVPPQQPIGPQQVGPSQQPQPQEQVQQQPGARPSQGRMDTVQISGAARQAQQTGMPEANANAAASEFRDRGRAAVQPDQVDISVQARQALAQQGGPASTTGQPQNPYEALGMA